MNKIFEKGGKLYWLHSSVDAFETFLHVPGTVTLKGSHVRDAKLMQEADRLYGITMQEKGVSALVSVDLIDEEELVS